MAGDGQWDTGLNIIYDVYEAEITQIHSPDSAFPVNI